MLIRTPTRPPIHAIPIPTASDEAVVMFGIFCLLATIPFLGVATQLLFS